MDYTIQPGDNLTKIARRAGVSIDAILAANPQITDRNVIGSSRATSMLRLPAGANPIQTGRGPSVGAAFQQSAAQPPRPAAPATPPPAAVVTPAPQTATPPVPPAAPIIVQPPPARVEAPARVEPPAADGKPAPLRIGFSAGAAMPQIRPPQQRPAIDEDSIRDRIVARAASYVGLSEQGGDNRGGGIGRFMRNNITNAAWCAGFTSTVMEEEVPGAMRVTMGAGDQIQQARRAKAYYGLESGYTPRRGDLIFFDRGEPGRAWQRHVGIVEGVNPDGSIRTIEGNRARPGMENAPYDPNEPDAVRRITYRPEEFAQNRILGFGDIMTMHRANGPGRTVEASVQRPTLPQL